MRSAPSSITCTFEKRPSRHAGELTLDLADLHWRWVSQLPGVPSGLRDAARDWLEVARAVHEIDRRMPRRISSDRVRSFRVDMAVREPDRWTRRAFEALSELLYVQGNADWSFKFRPRPKGLTTSLDAWGPKRPRVGVVSSRPIDSVVLFSGGLDSTSGAGRLRGSASRTLLLGYYSGNLHRQQEIAAKLGFPHLVQVQAPWSQSAEGRVGGQFWYRSFLYLTLGAVVSAAVKARRLYQFENGPLAFAVPPAPIYRMTRHAHPVVHRQAEVLSALLLDWRVAIANPFLSLTKHEAARELRRAVGDEGAFAEVVGLTETCWYLKARTIVGRVKKRVGQPCGVCIPCIVRQAALGSAEANAAVDLTSRSDRTARKPEVRVHLEAYRAFTKRILAASYGPGEFLGEIPSVTDAAVSDGTAGISATMLLDLYRRFGREVVATFG